MTYSCSPIWLSPHKNIRVKLKCAIDSAVYKKSPKKQGLVFFRADDIAVPGENLNRLIKLFTDYRVPLAMAMVPAWLTKPRWLSIKSLLQKDPSLWCLHQHGWRHMNHDEKGKKQEFGVTRTKSQKRDDIIKGRRRLISIIKKDFYPVFTPPWNRCDQDTIKALKDLDYHAVSRMNKIPFNNNVLQDFSVNVDLHTRKEPHPLKSMDILLKEIASSLKSELCGIMIHHQRMNNEAFSFLEALIIALRGADGVNITRLQDLVETHIN